MSKITESARGQECQVRLPGICNHNRETTVWAHLNGDAAGHGMWKKAPDYLGAYACSACHDAYDRRKQPDGMAREGVEKAFYEAVFRSQRILESIGLLKFR